MTDYKTEGWEPIYLTLSELIKIHNLVIDNHLYLDFYQKEFTKYRNKDIQLVEIGIDQGGSLILWAEYFGPNCKVLGVDLMLRGNCEKDCSKYPNIMLSTGNAYMVQSLQYMPEMDIFIDDGPHDIISQIFAIENFLPKVKSGGLFVIEDIPSMDTALTLMTHISDNFKKYAEIVDLRHVKGRSDDILFVVRVPEPPMTIETKNMRSNEAFRSAIEYPVGLGMDMLSERLMHLLPLIDFNDVKEIIDINAMHGYTSINFARTFPHTIIHSFEPDPENYVQAIENIRTQPDIQYSRIKLNNLALNDRDGPITVEDMMVPAASLDTWCMIHGIKPQLLWMDTQGSKLDILKGAEKTLQNVCVIMSEVATRPYYRGHTLKVDIDEYLKLHGFEELTNARKLGHEYEMDTIYIKKESMP